MSTTKKTRTESDFLGSKEIPIDAYYGVQSARGIENFNSTGQRLAPEIIWGVACVKKACARANADLGLLDEDKCKAIMQAADEVMQGEFADQFLLDPIQGGAGTSINMNVNEVIANRALEIMGEERGNYSIISPNSDVNMSQSTNDALPTGLHLAILRIYVRIEAAYTELIHAFRKKAAEFDDVLKMGRTHLQDAVPIRMGQEFEAYACVVERNLRRLRHTYEDLQEVNLGGTAVGTGLNADPEYIRKAVRYLSEYSGYSMTSAQNLIDATQNTDTYLAVMAGFKTSMISLSKIMNDLRLMASGPYCGLKEINLPERQAGSSIMPGKVNPVIPEAVNQTAFYVAGCEQTVMMACEAGQFELNVMEPVIVFTLLEAGRSIANILETFIKYCLEGITVNREICHGYIERSAGVISAINPHIGYEKASKIARKAVGSNRPVREVVLEEGVLTQEELDVILNPENMTTPGISGKELLGKKKK